MDFETKKLVLILALLILEKDEERVPELRVHTQNNININVNIHVDNRRYYRTYKRRPVYYTRRRCYQYR